MLLVVRCCASKRGHFWTVPGRANFNQSSAIARRNERFNFQLFHELPHLLGVADLVFLRRSIIKAH